MKTEESENDEENVKIKEMRKTSKLQKCGLRKTRKKRKRKNVAKQLQKKEENANFAENYVIAEITEKLNAYPREFSK